MENIMTSSDYRRVARENLQDNYWQSVLVSFVAMLLGGLIAGTNMFSISIDADVIEQLPGFLVRYLSILASISGILSLVRFIIGGTIQLGYSRYLLNQHNHAHLDIHELFSQFDRFKEGFLQSFLRGLYTFLWTLLFIIPGVIKTYAYAMTPFIMAENPDMTAKEAIEASKQMMDGHKWELFVLSLTFIGWNLLAGLTLNIGHIFLNPYVDAAFAAFYKNISAGSEPNPERAYAEA